MGRERASWREMEQKIGVKTSHKPVEDKQEDKKTSAKCHPRETRYEKGIPTFAGGDIIVLLTKN